MMNTESTKAHVDEIIAAAEGGQTARDPAVVQSWLRCINDYSLDPEHKADRVHEVGLAYAPATKPMGRGETPATGSGW